MRHATLYFPQTQPLSGTLLERAAAGAKVATKRRGLFSSAVASYSVRWPGLEVTLSFMTAEEIGEHLRGLSDFCLRRGAAPEGALLQRLSSIQRVVGCVASADDESGRMEQLVWSLARELDALVFLASGELFDGARTRCLPEAAESVDSDDDDDDDDNDDDDDECAPPAPDRVARRALALCGVTYRALIEADPPDDAAERLERLRAWLVDANVWEELEPHERALLRAPLGSLDQQSAVNGSWRTEGLAVLAWYLGLYELPPHDQQCDPAALWNACEFLRTLPPKILANPTTQSDEERARMASQLLGLHWRLRDFSLRPQAMDFRKFADDCWFGKMDLQGVALVGDDLSIGGKAIADAPREHVEMTSGIAMERHQAINWLNGWDTVYSEVDTST